MRIAVLLIATAVVASVLTFAATQGDDDDPQPTLAALTPTQANAAVVTQRGTIQGRYCVLWTVAEVEGSRCYDEPSLCYVDAQVGAPLPSACR